MRSKPRSLEDVLCAGGECRDGDEITMLLELSLKVFKAAPDKRAAADLMAAPARMQLPERLERARSYDAIDSIESAAAAAKPRAASNRRELRATVPVAAARRRR